MNENCIICFESYNDSDRKPKALIPCGHIVCGKCLDSINKCPKCRKNIEKSVIIWDLIPSAAAAAAATVRISSSSINHETSNAAASTSTIEEDKDFKLVEFQEITNFFYDIYQSRTILETNNWNVGQAVEIFFQNNKINNNGIEINILKGHTKDVICLVVLPNNQLASGSEGNTIRIWD